MKGIENRIGALEESITPKKDPLADEMARALDAGFEERLKDQPKDRVHLKSGPGRFVALEDRLKDLPELSPEEEAEMARLRNRLREKAA